jgi:hypothetical protein
MPPCSREKIFTSRIRQFPYPATPEFNDSQDTNFYHSSSHREILGSKCKIEATGVKVLLLVASSVCISLADKCDGKYC